MQESDGLIKNDRLLTTERLTSFLLFVTLLSACATPAESSSDPQRCLGVETPQLLIAPNFIYGTQDQPIGIESLSIQPDFVGREKEPQSCTTLNSHTYIGADGVNVVVVTAHEPDEVSSSRTLRELITHNPLKDPDTWPQTADFPDTLSEAYITHLYQWQNHGVHLSIALVPGEPPVDVILKPQPNQVVFPVFAETGLIPLPVSPSSLTPPLTETDILNRLRFWILKQAKEDHQPLTYARFTTTASNTLAPLTLDPEHVNTLRRFLPSSQGNSFFPTPAPSPTPPPPEPTAPSSYSPEQPLGPQIPDNPPYQRRDLSREYLPPAGQSTITLTSLNKRLVFIEFANNATAQEHQRQLLNLLANPLVYTDKTAQDQVKDHLAQNTYPGSQIWNLFQSNHEEKHTATKQELEGGQLIIQDFKLLTLNNQLYIFGINQATGSLVQVQIPREMLRSGSQIAFTVPSADSSMPNIIDYHHSLTQLLEWSVKSGPSKHESGNTYFPSPAFFLVPPDLVKFVSSLTFEQAHALSPQLADENSTLAVEMIAYDGSRHSEFLPPGLPLEFVGIEVKGGKTYVIGRLQPNLFDLNLVTQNQDQLQYLLGLTINNPGLFAIPLENVAPIGTEAYQQSPTSLRPSFKPVKHEGIAYFPTIPMDSTGLVAVIPAMANPTPQTTMKMRRQAQKYRSGNNL